MRVGLVEGWSNYLLVTAQILFSSVFTHINFTSSYTFRVLPKRVLYNGYFEPLHIIGLVATIGSHTLFLFIVFRTVVSLSFLTLLLCRTEAGTYARSTGLSVIDIRLGIR